jgi:hypothetical protein
MLSVDEVSLQRVKVVIRDHVLLIVHDHGQDMVHVVLLVEPGQRVVHLPRLLRPNMVEQVVRVYME